MKRRYKILVVDDDPKALLLMEAMLMPHGYDVVLVNDCKQAIPAIRKAEPDLILLDIMMPVDDGYTILNRLKMGLIRSNIPVVIVSAFTDDAHKVIASIDGASAYITKPINKKGLLETIAQSLPGFTS
jgi:CheY-like chemotaxis protein